MQTYETPYAHPIFPEAENMLNVDLLSASNETDGADNETSISNLLGGLL